MSIADMPIADDFATMTCSNCGWTCAPDPTGHCALCRPSTESATDRRMREDIAAGLPPEMWLGASDAEVRANQERIAHERWFS